MQLDISWNGANIASTSAPWTRRLYGNPEIGGIEWPVNSLPVAGLGHSFLGVGQPSQRTVQLAIESYLSGTPPTDLDNSLVLEHQALATIFAPRLGEKALAFTRTPSGGSPVTSTLYAVATRQATWRVATDANQPGVRRVVGRVLYPVAFQAAFPWFIRSQTGLTGNNTTLSGNVTTGDMPAGWQLVLTAGAGQTSNPKPVITVTVNGVAMVINWADETIWSGGIPYAIPVPWDQNDVAVFEFFYASGYERLGVVSYIREEGSTTNLRNWGVLVPDLANMTTPPLIPAAGCAISVTATGLAAGSTMAFNYATLHESF